MADVMLVTELEVWLLKALFLQMEISMIVNFEGPDPTNLI